MSGYERLEPMVDPNGEETIYAAYSANNGIHVSIWNDDIGNDLAMFHFDPSQAEKLGAALLRWAADRKAEGQK